MKYLCIDPSGTGTTGIFFYNDEFSSSALKNDLIKPPWKINGKFSYLFCEYKNSN